MSMNVSQGDGEDQDMSDINVTPLVDVMLVLLIIFLITVPVVKQMQPVNLPQITNIETQPKPENIVLVHLRRLGEQMDSLREDNREIKTRLGILEQQGALLSNRIDRIELRLDRIDKRLDLVDV